MVIPMTTNNPPLFSGGDHGSKSALDFNSFVRLDMKTLSQSYLFSLSRFSSYAFDPKYDVTPNIDSGHRSAPPHHHHHHHTQENFRLFSPAWTSPSQFRLRRRHTGDEKGSGRGKRTLAIPAPSQSAWMTRTLANLGRGSGRGKRRTRTTNSSVWGLTEGMEREDEFLGFLYGLEGRWGSSRKRRKYVDAAVFVKALPVNWKLLLSLRPRVRRPSLYYRRFVR
ncbi:hypothetical protein SSX86_010597 [Deinandra increscens subsp. villosa]|uniref:Uncharacterized protein n=1 Tax=Deinandra increscens subsp. villosa TaxID=3103831 RepID=A0AAP0H3C3_9ASTR